jgi:hypothetical protein
MCSRRWGRRARRRIDKGDSGVRLVSVFDICVMRCEGLGVVVLGAVLLLMLLVLTLRFLLLVELALVLLIL